MKALIAGIGGQDGAYLASFLLGKGYSVWGTSRDVTTGSFERLAALGVRDAVALRSMRPEDPASIPPVLEECQPDEIYFLSSQSSVGRSFEQPVETFASNCVGVLNLLEAVRHGARAPRIYHASSGECYGSTPAAPADEATPFVPQSPYAIAKAAAHALVANYRSSYSLFACNGILFNHESPLRPHRFVTRKVAAAAARIAAGSGERLALGRLDIVRDWGWAPEYVVAMWAMLQQPSPRDFVIATGEAHSLEQFVAAAFASAGLDWRPHVDVDPTLFRPTDAMITVGNPALAGELLGWQAGKRMADVARAMVAAEPA